MFDPTGSLIIELRDDTGVAGWTDRVRGGEPAPGDAKGAGEYQRFIVVVRLAPVRHPRVPIQTVRYGIRCYGTTPQDAAVGAGLVSDAIHGIGPRLGTGDFPIYVSHDDGGGGPDQDPDTKQPLEVVIAQVVAGT